MNAVRPPKVEPELVDITKVVTESIERFRKSREATGLEVYTHPMISNLFSIANHGSLCECISSLLKNAADACRPGDRIDVIAELLEDGDPDEAEIPDSARQIRIAIRDTGRGISATDLEQVWDLYYSGRDSGRGLGISLAKARRLIEDFQGRIWLSSNLNAGTTVEIRLSSTEPPLAPRHKVTL
jgi:signal transduction histidine kinase